MTAGKTFQLDDNDHTPDCHANNSIQQHDHHQQATNANYSIQKTSPNNHSLIRVETFASFSANQAKHFNILLNQQCEPSQLSVNVTNPIIGLVQTNLHWYAKDEVDNHHHPSNSGNISQLEQNYNKCRVTFTAPIVGLYTVIVEHATQTKCNTRFMTKAYDLSKVFIFKSSTSCQINESYEFSVDASEAGEGQLEIAVNEGEIPNQVQVLNNGKCIVSFVPEDSVPHMVDIKFNGHDVNGCPFVVEIINPKSTATANRNSEAPTIDGSNITKSQSSIPTKTDDLPEIEPTLVRDEKILVDTKCSFSLENLRLDKSELKDIIIVDPSCQVVDYIINDDHKQLKYTFECKPSNVGDYIVQIRSNSTLFNKLPRKIALQFPFPIKVFDFNRVIVSEVTDGVVDNPVYFFIDALQAGSGNLEIRVSSSTRNVPNFPQSEANAKIRVNFTPTEPIEHSIDIKFNGFPVPGNPFLVNVARSPQAKLTSSDEEKLKYVNSGEPTIFHIDYVGDKSRIDLLKSESCEVNLLQPDFVYSRIDDIKLIKTVNPKTNELEVKFNVIFKPTKIGPHKFFIKVNNELLPSSPIVSNVCNINEVNVTFAQTTQSIDGTKNGLNKSSRPIAILNKPTTFTVDASRAGEGTLALVVLSGLSQNPVQTEVNVSDKATGLYELTFVPVEFAPHTIDMSFNERCLPNSPFIVDIIDSDGNIASNTIESVKDEKISNGCKEVDQLPNGKQTHHEEDNEQLAREIECLKLKEKTGTNKANKKGGVVTSSKKSLAYGLVNASNIVYLETGVLENSNNQVSLIGPHGEKVSFLLAKGSPQRGEPKKTYIEYKPKEIGTHTINVLENGKDLRQYFLETCDPSLVRVIGLEIDNQFVVLQPVRFLIDSQKSGEIQLDNILIHGPKIKHKDGENTILGRIKSMSSSSNSPANGQCLEYSIHRLNEHQQEVNFVPQFPGKHSIYIKCLGQQVGSSPYEIDVTDNGYSKEQSERASNGLSESSSTVLTDAEILQNIIVHGVSLKCSPVNSTGAFIIETNRFAQATDFDVVVTDPNNSPVDVQFYLQQDANLLAEWMPKRVGPHKIMVLYKDEHVPGSPFITEAFDPSGVFIDKIQKTVYSVDEKIEFKVDRKHAGHGELDVAISSPAGNELPIDVKQLKGDVNVGELISFVPPVAGKYKLSILFGGFEIPNSPLTFTVRENVEPLKISGPGLRGAEVNRTAQFTVESSNEGQLKVRIECGDREIVPKVDQIGNCYTIKYKPIIVGYAAISLYWNGSHTDGSPFAVPVNDLSKILFLNGSNKTSNNNNQRLVNYEPNQPKDVTIDTAKCGPGELIAEAYCRANPSIKFGISVDQYAVNRYKLVFVCPPKKEQLAKGVTLDDISIEATYMIRFYYNNLSIPEQLASVVLSPSERRSESSDQIESNGSKSVGHLNGYHNDSNNNNNLKLHQGPSENTSNGLTAKQTDMIGPPIVSLRGHGLAEAKTGEQAEFTINGSRAGPGEPLVSLSSPEHEMVDVSLELTGDNIYLASYTPQYAGKYTLNVLWDDKQVAGCPLTVNVTDTCDALKVLCTGDGLKGGIFGEEIKVLIDTRRAGPGELTALCTGPQIAASSELLDRGDGTFILYIKPQEAGRHLLTIKYGGQQIPKSPFTIKVSGKPDPSKVRVHGPGVEHGVLSLYQSRFVCDTRGAGAGQLTVRIRGPKGAFRMETQRGSQRDRTILCKYDPTEPGDYRIEIKWSGQHVPGSPFHVMIFDTQEELNRFLRGLSPYYYNYM